jgi:hypothetical protein
VISSRLIAAMPAIGHMITNHQILILKKKILACLTEDFKGNQAIVDKDKGFAVFNGTDLEMIMDAVVKGLKFGQSEVNAIKYSVQIIAEHPGFIAGNCYLGYQEGKYWIINNRKIPERKIRKISL